MALLRRGLHLRVAIAAAALLCAGGAAAQDAPPPADSALTITARAPNAEFRIRGVSLKSVRADDAQNEVAFDFNGPVSDEAFARLQDELPDWIEMAYAGYDNAVIRAKRPVTFLTRAESDGFSMRIVPRDGGPGQAPPGLRGADDAAAPPPTGSAAPNCDCHPLFYDTHGWRLVQNVYARVATERPFDTLIRGEYDAVRDGPASVVMIDTDWRHSKSGTLYSGEARLRLAIWDDVKLIADVHDVLVNSKGVRQPGGAILPLDKNDVSGALGFAVPLEGGGASAELLYGLSGFGARLAANGASDGWLYGGRTAWHEPFVNTAEDIAFHADRDYSALYASGQIIGGLWGTGEIRATRYGIKGDANVATSAAFHAGLRYDLDGWPLSLNYDADGEYLLHDHKYPGDAPTPFVPLSLRNREVHALGAAFSDNWGRDVWFDLYGGYAIDRYANSGPYGGLGVRFTPAPGFDLSLAGRYSSVADFEGGATNKMTAGLKLTYAWGAGEAPIFDDL